MESYYEFTKYQGNGGVIVYLQPIKKMGRRTKWKFWFNEDSKICFETKSKIDALISAAQMNRRSAHDMNWRPI